jgi:hypothetical protein
MELDEVLKYIVWVVLMIIVVGGLILVLKKMSIL